MSNDQGTCEVVKGVYVHPEFPDRSIERLKSDADKFSIDDHLVALLFDEPFYSTVITFLHKEKSEAISTAGVLLKDEVMRFWWNPLFVAAYEKAGVRGILKHESLHLCLEHTTTRRYEPHVIWNWSCDLAINCTLTDDEFPKCGLRPGTKIKLPSNFETLTPEKQQRLLHLSSLIVSLPKDLTSEEYFTILMNDPEVKKMVEEAENLELGFDNHDGWDELTDEERQIVSGKIRAAVKAAQQRADAKNEWGSVPAHMREEIRKKVSGEIDWKSVLKSFVGSLIRSDRMSSIYKLNKRYPGIMPGNSRDTRPKLALFIDQSGSVSDEEIMLLFGEISSLSKIVDIVVYYFDTEVDTENTIRWKRGTTPKLLRTRCGGTDFEAPTRFIKNSKEKFEGYLILTDGGAGKPSASRVKRGWVLTPGNRLAFGEADSCDLVIKMKRPIVGN
jgi:predicted metal-dependent peptidase